ncbi:MAG TPA: arginase family protein [Candidatus Paceibacterota bacterium]|nr:arginase family protein [Candidatus Paceibacterota bacterium]
MTRVLKENSNIRILQIGIRGFSGCLSENGLVEVITQGMLHQNFEDVLKSKIPSGSKCYISLDVDVLDPVFAPGTGTPVPMGMHPRQLLQILEMVAKNNKIIGIDLVEVCPDQDRDTTADLVFHILMCLLGWLKM